MKKIALTALALGIFNAANATEMPVYIGIKGNLGAASIDKIEYFDSSESKWTSTKDDVETEFNYGLSASVGLNMSKYLSLPMRAELEYSYGRNQNFNKETDSDKKSKKDYMYYSSHLVMANAYYDFVNLMDSPSLPLTPYIGVGAGYAQINANKTKKDASTESITLHTYVLNINPGVTYKIDDNISLDASYRFTHTGEAKLKDEDGEDKSKLSQNHNHFKIGVRYSF